MKVEYEITRLIKLELTQEEAEWLRGYLQNAVGEESRQQASMRDRFFTALSKGLKGDL